MTATVTDFGPSLANILRVMRGGGRADRLLNDIEQTAEITLATKSDYNARSRAKHDLVCDLQSWWPDRTEHPDICDFEFGVCDAALRIVASILEGNGTQRSRATSDLHMHFRERETRLELEAKGRRDRQIDLLVAEAQLRHDDENRAWEANAAAITAANDNVESYVYFITDGEAIKIGKANNPKSRLSGLQTSHHKPLAIISTMPGGLELEREIHVIFDGFRLRGEWFKDCVEIRDFIERHGVKAAQKAAA